MRREALFEFDPDIDKSLLEFVVVQKLPCFRYVAIVADSLVHVEDDIESRLVAPLGEVMENVPDLFPVGTWLFLDDDLVEPQPDVVHSQRSDVIDVTLCDVRLEVLHVSNCDWKPPVQRKDVESLVVGQPAANTHSLFKTSETSHSSPLVMACI